MPRPYRVGRVAGALVVVGAVVLGGCGDPAPPMSESFCAELEDGRSPVNVFRRQVIEGELTAEEAAEKAWELAKVSCPEQLRTNPSLRAWLLDEGVDPDV